MIESLSSQQWTALVVAGIVLVAIEAWRRSIRDRAPRWVSIATIVCEIEIVLGVAYAQYGLYQAAHAIESADAGNKATTLARGISSAMNSNAVAALGVLVAVIVLVAGSVLARRQPDTNVPRARSRRRP